MRQSKKNGSKQRRKTARKQIKNNKGNKKSISQNQKLNITRIFLEMLTTVKLYHWKTRSYAQHKATDELYEKLNESIDSFVEILLGKDQSRLNMIEKRMPKMIDTSSMVDFKARIYEYREFLMDMNTYFDSRRDSDLLNVRDEILGHINQFLYLLSFDR